MSSDWIGGRRSILSFKVETNANINHWRASGSSTNRIVDIGVSTAAANIEMTVVGPRMPSGRGIRAFHPGRFSGRTLATATSVYNSNKGDINGITTVGITRERNGEFGRSDRGG